MASSKTPPVTSSYKKTINTITKTYEKTLKFSEKEAIDCLLLSEPEEIQEIELSIQALNSLLYSPTLFWISF
jgi:hypothetical protein